MSKLPPLPETIFIPSGLGYKADDMTNYATAATNPLLQRIAELEQRIEVGKNIVRNDMHRIKQLQARVTELERQLEEARTDTKPCPTCESLARAVMLDQTGKA